MQTPYTERDDTGLFYDVLSSIAAEGIWAFGTVEGLLDHLDREDQP